MAQKTSHKLASGLTIEVRKDHYSGLWHIRYSDDGMRYAGPFKTKREAIERLKKLADE